MRHFILYQKKKKKKKKAKAKAKKNIKTFFLVSYLKPANVKSLFPAPMAFLGPRAQLFQIRHSYSRYLLGIAVAIPNQARVNAMLRLLQLSHSYSKFETAIPSFYPGIPNRARVIALLGLLQYY